MFFSIHQGFPIDSRWNWERYTITKLTNMGEKYFQESGWVKNGFGIDTLSDLRIWVKNQEFGPGSGSIKLFLLGGCRPPDPLLFLGGFQPPGLQPPAPPRRFLRGSASQALRFFGTKILVPSP